MQKILEMGMVKLRHDRWTFRPELINQVPKISLDCQLNFYRIRYTPNSWWLFSWHTSLCVNFFGVSFVVVVFLPVWTLRSWSGDQRVMMSDNQKSPSRRNVDKMTIWHHSPSLWAWMNQKRRWLRCILKLENMDRWSDGCQSAIKNLYSLNVTHVLKFISIYSVHLCKYTLY